jgi:hypothetical protein
VVHDGIAEVLEAQCEMVLDVVCDENGVESVQLCSWWSNGVNESSSVVPMDVKGTNVVGRFKATVAVVSSRLSRSWAAWVTSRGRQRHRTHKEVPAVGTGAGQARDCSGTRTRSRGEVERGCGHDCGGGGV